MFSVVVIDFCAIFAIIDVVFFFFRGVVCGALEKSFRYKVLISKVGI